MFNKISEIAKQHNKYVALVKSWGEKTYHEDIVQEMYIKILRKNDTTISDGYIWITLRTLFLDLCRLKAKQKIVDFDVSQLSDENTDDEIEAYNYLINKINTKVNKLIPYDALCFNINVKNGVSFNKISNGANISKSSVFESVKATKQMLFQQCEKDYINYLNSKK